MSIVLMLLACQAPVPYVFSEARLKDDGVHVEVSLTNIERVEIEGQSVAHGESVVLPLSLFHVGVNELPILGEGLVDETLYLEIRPDRALTLKCTGSANGRVHIREAGEESRDAVSALNCAVGDGGYVTGKLTTFPGSTIMIDGQEIDGPFRLDARSGLWEEPLVAQKAGKEVRSSKEHQLPIVVRHSSGEEWAGTINFMTGGTDLMGSFIRNLPESAQGMPAGDAVALRWGTGWRFSGSGQLGQLARFAKVVDESKPRSIASCNYQGAGGAVSIKTVAVDRTVLVVDRQGSELGRKVFKADVGGYSCSDIQFEGGGDVTLVPEVEDILAWAQGL